MATTPCLCSLLCYSRNRMTDMSCEPSATMTTMKTRSSKMKIKSYICDECDCMASRFIHLVILHKILVHACKDKDVDVICRTKRHAVSPGCWDKIGGGIYEETIQLLAIRTWMTYTATDEVSQKSLRTLVASEAQQLNGVIGRHARSLLEYLTARRPVRGTLTKLAEELNCADSNFHAALVSDEEKIAEALKDTIDRDRDSVLALRGERAVNFLDLVDTIICNNEGPKVMPPQNIALETRRLLYRNAVRVAQEFGQLPTRMTLSNVSVEFGDNHDVGSYGVVYKAVYQGEHVALKLLHDRPGQSLPDNKRSKSFCKEVAILSYLNHPNICSFTGIYKIRGRSKIGLVTPWISGGNIVDFVTKQTKSCGWQEVLVMKFIHQVLLGLSYLHRMGVIHADLHPCNILVNQHENIQLIDFGLSNFSGSTPATAGTLRQGAEDYMAPEIIVLCKQSDLTHTPLRYTEGSDMFSFAQICWRLFIGKNLPRTTDNIIIPGSNLQRSDSLHLIPDCLWQCLVACWSLDTDQRPSAATTDQILLEHYTSNRNIPGANHYLSGKKTKPRTTTQSG